MVMSSWLGIVFVCFGACVGTPEIPRMDHSELRDQLKKIPITEMNIIVLVLATQNQTPKPLNHKCETMNRDACAVTSMTMIRRSAAPPTDIPITVMRKFGASGVTSFGTARRKSIYAS